jgi:hypothetical protein
LSVAEEGTGKETGYRKVRQTLQQQSLNVEHELVYRYNIVGKPSSITLCEILGSEGSTFEDSDLLES